MSSGNGLDFGTSTIFVATGDGVVPIGESRTWMPSLVGYADDGSVLAGERAFDVDGEQQVRSIKRFITEGRNFAQLDTPTGIRDIRVDELIVGMLREAVRRAQANGVKFNKGGVLLGCPAMWDGPQRRRLHDLAVRAGLDVTMASLVDEPVAAGIAWLSRQSKLKAKTRIVVFDMGGGTLDLAVIEAGGRGNDDMSVLAALGVAEAGNFLDQKLAEDLEYVLATQGVDIRTLERPRRARARLLHAARDVKIILSSVPEVDVKLPRREFGIASMPYRREQLNEVFSPQMDRAEQYLITALRVARLPGAADGSAFDIARVPVQELTRDVDVVVLSGGMSRVPYVAERLGQLFGEGTRIEFACAEPDNAVALGLAKASKYGRINKYRPAFDIVVSWDSGREQRTVYEAFTPLVEMRQIAEGSTDLRYIRTGRQLKLPGRGKGVLRVVSHSGEKTGARLNGSKLDGFPVAFGDFEFSISPDGRIHLSDGEGDYDGRLDGWQ